MGLSRTLSETPKMNAVTSVHVGLLRKSSWSAGLRIRREGVAYVWFERFGGGGSAGVRGGGADGGSRLTEARFRGMSLGIFAERSGGGELVSAEGMVCDVVCRCRG